MVRIIVGTLLEIGKYQIKIPLKEILESKDRNNAGTTVNPRGLIFLGPNYENITKFKPRKEPFNLNMKIKICGITEIETLNFLIENRVDYVGFIFHENSPRNVTHAFINEIKNNRFPKN